MALTDAKIKALKPKAARYQVADGRGLSVDVMPSGVLSWLYRYRFQGKYERVPIGHYPVVGLKAARDRRDEYAAMLAGGRSPAAELRKSRTGIDEQPTVESFADRFYREQVVPNRKNPIDIKRYLDKDICGVIGKKLLTEVTALDVQAIVYRKRDNGRVAAALLVRRIIRQMFDYAVELQLVLMNPAAMVATKYVGKAKKRDRALSQGEIRSYLQILYKSNIRRQFKIALHLLLLTLTRKSELMKARWEHIDFDKAEWRIPPENSKMGRTHLVYLSTQAAALFKELEYLSGSSELVLPGRASLLRPFADNALNKALEGVNFNMPAVTVHDLRRTGATQLREHGFDADVVEKALAHEVQGVRGHYIVAEYAVERRRMLQWWADYVESIVTESKLIEGNFKRA